MKSVKEWRGGRGCNDFLNNPLYSSEHIHPREHQQEAKTMFKSKKKSKLPARPNPPSWEEMEEDLRVVAKEDFIFALKVDSAGKERAS